MSTITTKIHSDSHKKTLAETSFDIITGFLIYLPVNYFVLPLFSDAIAGQELFGMLQISAVFMSIALVRKYAIRRWFETMRTKSLQKLHLATTD